MSTESESVPWHATDAAEVANRFGVDPERGLDHLEARRRLTTHGPNEILRAGQPSALAIFARQFTSFLTVLLVAAGTTSGLVLGEWVDAAAIGAIIVLNATIGFIQEYRAATALTALESLNVPSAHVIRDGQDEEVPGAHIVPGDVISLSAGDRIPADGRLMSIRDFEADESTLTGESLPVSKSTESVGREAGLGDRIGMVYGGTTVARGRGRAVVVATGTASEVGKLAELTSQREPPTPLQRELDIVGRRLAAVAGVSAIVIIGLGMARGLRFETMVLTGVALAVAVIPEGLPTVVAVTLARGMERMARWNALVRRLSAVEALGGASVICTDKTGTLTENRLAVRKVSFLGKIIDADTAAHDFDGRADDRLEYLLDVMIGCNDAYRSNGEYMGDALDVALLRSAEELDDDVDARRRAQPRITDLPFDSQRKRMDVIVEYGTGVAQLVKGAPEVVMEACDKVAVPGGFHEFDRDASIELDAASNAMAREGLRTVALARQYRDRPPLNLAGADDGLVLIGIVGLADRPRPAVRDSVQEAKRAGIEVVMITGDHQITAETIGARVGIVERPEQVMSGDKLRSISQSDLDETIDQYRAFSRVDPADKVKIVTAWQHRSHVVAMTGDGVNDGPALRAADIGVAMGSGTDVAKDASGMVLEDDDFSTIVDAVREGRKIFMNLRNVVHYLLSANSSEIITMVIGFTFFGALGEPLRATQLLWINLVSDGLPALALGLDEPDEDVMTQNPGTGRDVLSARNIALLVTQGAFLAAPAIAMIVVGHSILGRPWIVTQTMVFTTLVIAQLLHAFNMQTRPLSNLWGRVGLAVLSSLGAHVLVVNWQFTQSAFSVVALGAVEWAWALGAAIIGFAAARSARRLIEPTTSHGEAHI